MVVRNYGDVFEFEEWFVIECMFCFGFFDDDDVFDLDIKFVIFVVVWFI